MSSQNQFVKLYPDKKRQTLQRNRSCGGCLRFCIIVIDAVFAVIALALIGVFVFLWKYKVDFVRSVLGTDLIVAACGLLIAAGCLLFIVTIIGIIGAAIEHTCLLVISATAMVIVLFTLLAGIICTVVFRAWLTEQVRLNMKATLISTYGVDLGNSWNQIVTTNWDAAQLEWQCCAVDDNSWSIYQKSSWFDIQPGTPDSGKPYVPASCCKTDSSGQPMNLLECQTKKDGPPARLQGDQYGGGVNPSLYYRGCYEMSKDYLMNEYTWYIMGTAIGVIFLLLNGISLSVALACILRERIHDEQLMLGNHQTNSSQNTLTFTSAC